jgi:hypothetical protein
MITMTIARALKLKNKLVSELKSTEDLIRSENVTEGENKSQFEVKKLYAQLKDLRLDLCKVKGAIASANAPIFQKIFTLSELKAHIAFLKTLPTKTGTFDEGGGYASTFVKHTYTATITKQDTVGDIILLEKEIESLQEELDTFNHNTAITIDIVL